MNTIVTMECPHTPACTLTYVRTHTFSHTHTLSHTHTHHTHSHTHTHTYTHTPHSHSQELLDEKSELDQMQEKVKLLQKLLPDCPIPLEVFDSDVHLVKQGSLIQVVGKKEMQRMCFLFNRYIAVAESVTPAQYRILEVQLTNILRMGFENVDLLIRLRMGMRVYNVWDTKLSPAKLKAGQPFKMTD